ncbi:MAG: hypothetical protein QNJ81_12305 [Acidimicrobiia bacterium]|nr:hypothetical protein [Acidimicrobiia bacterium]
MSATATARAMVAEPKILVLDEATRSIDTRIEKRVREGLARLTEGRTSFVITHRLATIRRASIIMVRNGGRIVEFGPHEGLIAARRFYYALHMNQFRSRAEGPASGADLVGT